ncbi:hypothetical protein ESCO_003310 [Escovopsis weberi]|uniref:AB hydrolase-1 domain-containing protein n=1 Tax=Escovopsis weberi TaxID=150374 RepID=A0A0M8MRZ4_ESCWE|nr:hypothetical protein ESCO_003310 [Escovopsis weberi]
MKVRALLSAAAALFNSSSIIRASHHQHHPQHPLQRHHGLGREAAHARSFFYAGGQYIQTPEGEFLQDQIYVEKLTPQAPEHVPPIVLIHGQGQTGTNFLNKPDGGEGWASLFVRHGHEVYIVDQPYRGRSPWIPPASPSTPTGVALSPPFSVAATEQFFTATARHKLWPQAANHTQWPGSGTRGDPVFDAFYAANTQFSCNETQQQLATQAAGAALLDTIGRPAVVLGHSQGSTMPLLLADARPSLVAALVLVEPTGPPFEEVVFRNPGARPWGLSEVPMAFAPPVADPAELVTERHAADGEGLLGCVLQGAEPRRLANLEALPILLVTGEASYHAQYDHCTARFLRQAGCSRTEHLELGKAGVHGNGHFLFLEKNSDDIHALVEAWISGL